MKRIILVLCGAVGQLAAQSPPPLQGTYHYQYLSVSMPGGTATASVRGTAGKAVFDGSGEVSFDGAAAAYTAGGGFVILSAPGGAPSAIRARVGMDAAVILGSSTESSGLYDLFVAVKAPGTTPSPLSGEYHAVALVFPGSRTTGVRAGFTTFQASEAGIQFSADGAGVLTLPLTTPLPIRSYNARISAGGDVLIGSPVSAAGLLVAVKADRQNPSGLYWLGEMAVERGRVSSSIGSLSVESGGTSRLAQRWNTKGGSFDFRGVSIMAFASPGVGRLEGTTLGAGAPGAIVGAAAQTGMQSLLFAIRAPAMAASVTDAASLAPPGSSVAPASLVSVFGMGLAPRATQASSLPLPQSLEGVQVEANGRAAGLHSVSPAQLNLLLPASLEGSEISLVVRNNQAAPIRLVAPLARSSPAIFPYPGSGGVITHADYRIVDRSAPARRGEPLIAFATGAGVDEPPLGIWVGGVSAEVLYSGPSAIPGVDQINFRLPLTAPTGDAVPVMVTSREGYSDTAAVAIAP